MYPLAHRERRASRRGIRDARIAFCRTAGGSYGKLEGRRQKLEGGRRGKSRFLAPEYRPERKKRAAVGPAKASGTQNVRMTGRRDGTREWRHEVAATAGLQAGHSQEWLCYQRQDAGHPDTMQHHPAAPNPGKTRRYASQIK